MSFCDIIILMAAINISDKLKRELKKMSQKLGISQEDLLSEAILYYLQTLKNLIDLRRELEIWEKTSDIDLVKFEKDNEKR
jgi:hypothetical protein